LLMTPVTGCKLKVMMRKIVYTLVCILLWNLPAYSSDPIIVEHADSSHFQIIDDEIITTLFGFERKVHLKQGETDLYADTVIYSSKGFYKFYGGVNLTDTTRSIHTDFLSYDQNTSLFWAIGASHLLDLNENIRLDGDSVAFDDEKKILTVTGQPYIAFNIDDPRKLIQVRSDSLQYFSEQKHAYCYRNVNITKGSLVAECNQAILLPDSNRLILKDDPQAFQYDNSIYGDSMTIYLKDDLLDHLDVVGKAKAIYRQKNTPEDTVFAESKLNARKITFLFSDEQLTQIVSAGNSYSEYKPLMKDTLSSARNLASGDSIKLHFDDRRLHEVEILISCQGQYFFNSEKNAEGAIITEDTINYNAEHLRYIIGDNSIRLYKKGKIIHETVILEADSILYNTDTKILTAHSIWDHHSDTDSVFVPVVLKDKNDVIYGERLVYNLETRRGKIKESDTQMEQAYYHGATLRKEEEDVILVDKGSYTTCEYDDPHYHFYSKNMKLINDDRVIARPIILYIDKIPIFYLPYFVFSIKKGRHSGFLPFQFGNFERGSRFVNNLGYYWALSDYYDLETSLDYNDEVGVTFNAGFRYKLRYKFSGSISGSYAREIDYTVNGENKSNRWKLNLSHSHTLSETSSLKGSGNFVSDSRYYPDISTDPDERLNRNLRSQLNFSKRWGSISLTAVVSGTNNLDKDNTTYSLPTLSFNVPSRPLIKTEKGEDKRWYQNLYLSYRVNSVNYISKTGTDTTRTSRHYANLRHNSSISLSTKILKYVTISPSATINENWFYIFDTDQSREQELMSETGLRRMDFRFALGAKSNIYGLFRPPVKGLIGLRHVLTPSISFSYRPKSERHQEEASFTGVGTGGAESQSLNLSLGNLFQIKYKSGEKERKLDLFTLNFSTGYNFKSNSYKWSRLNTTLRSSTIPHLTFSMNTSHDLYNQTTGKLDIFGAHLTNISFSSNFNYSGKMMPFGSAYSIQSENEEHGSEYNQSDKKFPWSVSLGHRYSENRSGTNKSITHWITTSAQFNLTKNWKVSFSQNYDIKRKEITERSFQFIRDLHCWEAVFYWIPNGSRKGYYFKIAVKALPDIKFEKSESGIRGMLFDNF